MDVAIALSSLIGIVTIMLMIIFYVSGRHAAVTQYSTRPQSDQTAVIQAVQQAMLYIWASLIPCAVIVIATIIVQGNEQIPRLLLALLMRLIRPFQGLFKLIIYVRSRYIAMQQKIEVNHSFLTTLTYIVVREHRPEQTDRHIDELAPELANEVVYPTQMTKSKVIYQIAMRRRFAAAVPKKTKSSCGNRWPRQ